MSDVITVTAGGDIRAGDLVMFSGTGKQPGMMRSTLERRARINRHGRKGRAALRRLADYRQVVSVAIGSTSFVLEIDAYDVREAFAALDRGEVMSVEESAAYLRSLLDEDEKVRTF